MPQYASQTTVSPEKSRNEIERTLVRYGADQFAYGWDNGQKIAVIRFAAHGRQIMFRLPLPDRDAREFTHTPNRGAKRPPAAAEKAYDQAVRQRWRALALAIKAKLEAVEAGIVSFEQEFLAHIMLPTGETVGEWAQPQLEAVYSSGGVPALMPGSSS